MSEKIYYNSPYTKKWSTKITELWEDEEKIYVTLEKTNFYPEGGGQPCDKGTIEGIKVIDVQLIQTKVVHQLEKPPSKTEVDCIIDWQVRFDHMQQHTGQHLLSAVLYDLYAIPTTSFHLGKDHTTIDLKIEDLHKHQLVEMEQKCNALINENKKISTYFVTNKELKNIPLRKLPSVSEPIRIVEMEEIDFSACAGTHVKSTGELGLLKLIKTEKHRGQIRLFFLVGNRAMKDYQLSQQILDQLSDLFQTNKQLLMDRIQKQEEEKKQLTKEMDKLKAENSKFLLDSIMSNQNSPLIRKSFTNKPLKDLQQTAKEIVKEQKYIVLFSSTLERKALLMHSGNYNFSCGDCFKQFLQAFNGKGGGNKTQAQAIFSSQEDLNDFLEKVQTEINTFI
ncbi:MAG: DHHA1 domain-containing protein [Bacillus sp. (in: firmicutes)]